jgi:hypothetical protein
MTDRESKIVRFGAIGIVVYLVLFFGFKASKSSQRNSAELASLAQGGKTLQQEFLRFETRRLLLDHLNETFHFDPAKISRNSIVADASAAIQTAARAGGVKLGPIRESSARASSREMATMQLEGAGPVPAIMKFLYQVNTLGFPLVIDELQMNADKTRPGNIKINLTIVVLDYEQWRKGSRA